MRSLKGKTLFITGASRGIGKAIAMRAARDGANIVVAAKTTIEHKSLPGTIYSAACGIEAAGGSAMPIALDVRDEAQVASAVEQAVQRFGGIDIVVNNASAISLTDTANTSMKRFDLMMSVNLRGTYAVTQACLPHLLKADNPHVLVLSPPPSLAAKWFSPHVAYTISKMGMSLCVLGWAEEFQRAGIGGNALWPRTLIDTSALRMLGDSVAANQGRHPEIVADAAHAILTRPARECSGNFFIDEEVLRQEGVTDFTAYAVEPGSPLLPDFFL